MRTALGGLASLLMLVSDAASAEAQLATESKLTPSYSLALSQSEIEEIASRIGLKEDLESLLRAKPSAPGEDSSPRQLLAEARFVKRLCQAEIQLDRIIAQIDLERTLITLAINKIENRKTMLAKTTDSINFLASGIISVIGNGLFIPAPPPRPTVPNILFSIANGVSTALSVLTLVELRGGKAKLRLPHDSMLLPIFAPDFKPTYSEMVWTYLSSPAKGDPITPRQQLLQAWHEQLGPAKQSAEVVSSRLGLSQGTTTVSLKNLYLRQAMLCQLEVKLVQLSTLLSDLAHAI